MVPRPRAVRTMIAALSAAIIALAAPFSETDSAFAARAEELIAQRRFFDAHVYCMVGAALSGNDEKRAWYVLRDAFSLWMLGESVEAMQALAAAPAASKRDRELLAFAAAWLQTKRG